MLIKLINYIVCVIIALLCSSVLGCSDQHDRHVGKDTVHTPFVSVAKMVPASAQTTRIFNGTVRRSEQALLSFETVGTLKNLEVLEGDRVKKGKIIARLDSTIAEQQVQQAQTLVADRQSELGNIALTHQRIQSLLKRDFASQAEFDESLLRLNSAKNAVANANASLLSAKQRLNDTVIRAPYNSVISEVLRESQEQVGALQPIVRILREDTRSQIEIRIDESLATSIKIGSMHTASILALGLDNIAVSLQEVTANSAQLNSYKATFISDTVIQGAIDGLSATVSVAAPPVSSLNPPISANWFIPHGSYKLMPQGDAYVFRVDKDTNKLQKVMISVIDFNDDGVLAAGELKEGQVIVNKGVSYLTDGLVVRTNFQRPKLINE